MEDFEDLVKKNWPVLLLAFLIVGFLVAVNNTPEEPVVSFASPSVKASLAASPTQSAQPVEKKLLLSNEPFTVRQSVVENPLGVTDTLYIDNDGSSARKVVLLKFVPQEDGVSTTYSEGGETERLGSVQKTIFDVQSGERVFFEEKTPEKTSLPYFVFEDGKFSPEFQARLFDLLAMLGQLPPGLSEAAQNAINDVLNDPNLSEQEKREWIEAFVQGVLDVNNSELSEAAKLDAINVLAKAKTEDIPGLVEQLTEPVKDTRACERLPTGLKITILRCVNVEQPVEKQQECSCKVKEGKPKWEWTETQNALPASIIQAPDSGPFKQEIMPKQDAVVMTPCNPSHVTLVLHADDDGIDKGVSVGRFSTTELSNIIAYEADRSDSVLDARFEIDPSKLDVAAPWDSGAFSLDSLKKVGASLPVEVDPFVENGNSFLNSLVNSGSLAFNDQEEEDCINLILQQSSGSNAVKLVSITLEPLEVKVNGKISASCSGGECPLPEELCAVKGQEVNFDFESPELVEDIKIYRDSVLEWTGDAGASAGAFSFTPTETASYSVELGGKTVSFSVKNSAEECAPPQELPENCKKFLNEENKLSVGVELFEFDGSGSCVQGVFTGVFGRVVSLPCNAAVEVCVKFITLGKTIAPI